MGTGTGALGKSSPGSHHYDTQRSRYMPQPAIPYHSSGYHSRDELAELAEVGRMLVAAQLSLRTMMIDNIELCRRFDRGFMDQSSEPFAASSSEAPPSQPVSQEQNGTQPQNTKHGLVPNRRGKPRQVGVDVLHRRRMWRSLHVLISIACPEAQQNAGLNNNL